MLRSHSPLNFKLALLFCFLYFIVGGFFVVNRLSVLATTTSSTITEAKLTEEELNTLVRPAVVRVLHRLNGEVIFKPVDLDIKTLSFKPAKGEDKKYPLENYDTYGTGFFINSDGYLITNAHVVSLKIVQIEAAAGYAAGSMATALLKAKLTEKESRAVGERILAFSDEEKEKFRNDILDYVKVVATSTLAVVRPGENSDSKFDILFDKGYPASLVSLSEDFIFNDRDFAVLKIDKKILPFCYLVIQKVLLTVSVVT